MAGAVSGYGSAGGQGQVLRQARQNNTQTMPGSGTVTMTGNGGVVGPQKPAPKPAPKPTPIITSTPVDPMQKSAYDAWNDYNSGLANNTNTEITHEIGRARDDLSIGLGKEVEGALLRGADPNLFATRFAEGGRRSLNDLQAKLTDVALGRRAEALGGVTTSADRAASGQRELHLGTAAQSLAERRLALEAAEAKRRTTDAAYDRLLGMLGHVGDVGGMTGGGGGFYSGSGVGGAPTAGTAAGRPRAGSGSGSGGFTPRP